MRSRLLVLPALVAGLITGLVPSARPTTPTPSVTSMRLLAPASVRLVTPARSVSSARSASVPPGTATHTLTLTGINLAGKPDSGGQVQVDSVDNAHFGDYATFHSGTATMKVPGGHFWAAATFSDRNAQGKAVAQRMVVIPQFTVSGDTTVRLDERTATSKITIVTPRPSQDFLTVFQVLRPGASGPNSFAYLAGSKPLYVSPTTRRPTAGTLQVLTQGVRLSPSAASGTPYEYNLDHLDTSGLIRSGQNFVVPSGSLATVRYRYYSDIPQAGFLTVIGVPRQLANEALLVDVASARTHLPGTRTMYLTAGHPAVVWEEWEQSYHSADGQLGPYREYRPGQQVTEDWGAFPLHPAPNVNLVGSIAASLSPSFVSASRSGSTLSLDMWPFSDNDQHTGTRFTGANDPTAKVTGTYQIDSDGKKIASGSALRTGVSFGDFHTTANIGSKPTTIRFTLNTAVTGANYPLSPATYTVWTWRSVPEPGATVPLGWACRWVGTAPHLRGRNCAAQPMMTLNYKVAGLGLDGSAPAGAQSLQVSAGHIQPVTSAANITTVAVQVSFDGGKTWRAANVTGSGANRRVTFTAAAGRYVTLRVTAADAAEGSISNTITRAYQTAS